MNSIKDAQDVVILSEGGIAKGVRRIVACTRDDAKKARTDAQLLQQRQLELREQIGQVESLQEYDQANKDLTKFKLDLEQSEISTVVKSRLMESSKKELWNELNAKKKSLSKKIVQSLLENLDKTSPNVCIQRVDCDNEVLMETAKASGFPVILLCTPSSQDETKFQGCLVVQKGQKAKANELFEPIKASFPSLQGGGKDTLVSFRGEIGDLDAVVNKMKEVAQSSGLL